MRKGGGGRTLSVMAAVDIILHAPSPCPALPLTTVQIPTSPQLWSTTPQGLVRSCHTDGFGGPAERVMCGNPAFVNRYC